MSGIYIPGMEMPTEGFVEILIRDDGTVLQTGQSYRVDGTDYYTPYVGEMPVIYKAIPVPDHGRLIDADALPYTRLYKENWIKGAGREAPAVWKEDVDSAPTIIPASGGNENE